jgi:hypothetical protein
MKKAEQQKQWAAREATFRNSGQSLSAWCKANDLNPRQFRYWLEKGNKEATPATTPSQWLSMEVDVQEVTPQNNALIVRMGQATVEVKLGFDQKLLLDVLRTLGALC